VGGSAFQSRDPMTSKVEPYWVTAGCKFKREWTACVHRLIEYAVLDTDLDTRLELWVLDNVFAHHHDPAGKMAVLDPGGGFGSVQVRMNSGVGKKPTRGFHLVSKDRSISTDFSWTKLRGTPDECLPIEDGHQQDACRDAVSDTVLEFRRATPPVCALCGTSGPCEFHVDHFPVMFIDIFLGWKAGFTGSLETVDAGIGRRFADPATAASFKAFHDPRADFRLVCRPCHDRQKKGPARKRPTPATTTVASSHISAADAASL